MENYHFSVASMLEFNRFHRNPANQTLPELRMRNSNAGNRALMRWAAPSPINRHRYDYCCDRSDYTI